MSSVSPGEQKATHWTTWEDDMLAGVRCSKNPHVYAGVISAGEQFTCEACGASLRLSWIVSIEEIESPEKKP